MTKRELQERRKRRRRNRRLRILIRVVVYVLMALLVGGVIGAIYSLFFSKEDEPVESAPLVQESTAAINDATRTTYTGNGGKKGWNVDELGWWFLNDDETIFTNGWQTVEGNTYYFDENGYMATGWQQIEGAYHYFRPDGIEEPGATEKLVAITYDDGPSSYTDRLLDCLVANGAKATFFVVGTNVENFKETVSRAESLGMEIGSHTYNHPYLLELDAEGVRKTMNDNEEAIISALGHGTTLMRPTGGGVNDTIRENVDRPLINWDLDTKDWQSKDVDSIVDKVLSNVKDGSVILLHDIYETTVTASEIFIPELVSRGYRMVTISELAELRGVTLENGEVYTSFYLPEPEAESIEAEVE